MTALDLRCHPCTTGDHPHERHACVCPCTNYIPFAPYPNQGA